MFKLTFSVLMLFFLLCGCGSGRDALSPVDIRVDSDIADPITSDVSSSELPSSSTGNNTYVVKADETLFDIANKFFLDPMDLAKANKIKRPYKVVEGQVLKLPGSNSSELANKNTKALEKGELLVSTKDEYIDPAAYQSPQENELENELKALALAEAAASGNNAKNKGAAGQKGSVVAHESQVADEAEHVLSVPKISKNEQNKNAEANKKREHIVSDGESEVAYEKPTRKFATPISKGKVVSKFRKNNAGKPDDDNDGVNIKLAKGSSVTAANSGEVIYVGNKLEDHGNVVMIEHDGEIVTSYSHLDKISVKNGVRVKKGQKIGTAEPVIHFEVMKNKQPVDPEKYVNF